MDYDTPGDGFAKTFLDVISVHAAAWQGDFAQKMVASPEVSLHIFPETSQSQVTN